MHIFHVLTVSYTLAYTLCEPTFSLLRRFVLNDIPLVQSCRKLKRSKTIKTLSYEQNIAVYRKYSRIEFCLYRRFPLRRCKQYLNRLMTKPAKWHVRPVKTKINLGIGPVWSESALSAWRKLGSLATHWAHSKDSDQTWRTRHFAGFVIRWLIYKESNGRCWPLNVIYRQKVSEEV